MNMLPGIALGLTAAACWGTSEIFAALGSRRIGALRAVVAVQILTLAALVGLAVATGVGLPSDPGAIAVALVSGGIAAITYLAYFAGLRHGPISVVSPIVAGYGAVTVVLAVSLLGETVTPFQVAGAVVTTAGLAMASVVTGPEGGRLRFDGRGVVMALVATFGFAFATVSLSWSIARVGWLPTLLVARAANAGLITLLLGAVLVGAPGTRRPPVDASVDASVDPPLVAPQPIIHEPAIRYLPARHATAWYVALAALFDVAALVVFAVGLEVSLTWLVGLASSLGPVATILAGVSLFRERPRRSQWAGIALVFASLPLLAIR